MGKKKTIIIFTTIAIVALLGGGSFLTYQKFFQKENIAKTEVPVEKNYFEINDETAGIYFRISKNFDRMTAQELQMKSPVFIYGFKAKNDKTAYCIISQTKRDRPGIMKVIDLRDGVLDQVKKSYPDAVLDNSEIVSVGENNKLGPKLQMSYTDNSVPKIQWEIVGITEKTATFAFCVAPKAVLDLYQDDFNLFLNSVRIK